MTRSGNPRRLAISLGVGLVFFICAYASYRSSPREVPPEAVVAEQVRADSQLIASADTADIELVVKADYAYHSDEELRKRALLALRHTQLHRLRYAAALSQIRNEMKVAVRPERACEIAGQMSGLPGPIPDEFRNEYSPLLTKVREQAVMPSGCGNIPVKPSVSEQSSSSSCDVRIDPGATLHEVPCSVIQAVSAVVKTFGYACGSVTGIHRDAYSSHTKYSIFCEEDRYHYSVEDVGGNWTVTVR